MLYNETRVRELTPSIDRGLTIVFRNCSSRGILIYIMGTVVDAKLGYVWMKFGYAIKNQFKVQKRN